MASLALGAVKRDEATTMTGMLTSAVLIPEGVAITFAEGVTIAYVGGGVEINVNGAITRYES